jgi:hypothetical protein
MLAPIIGQQHELNSKILHILKNWQRKRRKYVDHALANQCLTGADTPSIYNTAPSKALKP